MQHFTKGAIRVAKNYTKGYSDTQSKVREATSNDPWGPSGTQMNEIAQLTYNQQDFVEIMEMLDKRLNDKGKNWRHVFKSLTLLDYCLHQGSENVVLYFRDNIYVVKTLKEFQYVDEEGKDQGSNVRQKAKDITNLLQDEGRLRQERRARASMRDRMIRGGDGDGEGEFDDENAQRRQKGPQRRQGGHQDEDDLRKAIEESKRSLALERQTAEDRDLAQAIKLSEEEEEKRAKTVEDTNATSLFDDSAQAAPAPQNNNPFPLTDPTPYAVGLNPQPQFQMQPQFTAMQPQFTAFNPYQQQLEQERAQQEFLQQQALFQQQQAQEEWMRQQMMQQQMMQQQAQQQQQQQQNLFAQQPIAAQPTGFGSNNPFAASNGASTSPPPPLPTHTQPSFNLGGTYENKSNAPDFGSLSPSPSSQSQPQQQPQQQSGPAFKVKTKQDENAHLANLFANRDDGQDTFGNVGALRYGHAHANNFVTGQPTGSSHNPFAIQQQQQQQQSAEQPFFSI